MLDKRMVILCAGLIVGFCFFDFSPSLSQAEVTLTVEDGTGPPGSTDNQVAVSLANPDDKVKGVQLDVCDVGNYLSCSQCETTERTSGFACTIEEDEDEIGCCSVIILDFAEGNIHEGEGPILTLIYDVSEEAPSGECSDLNVEEVKVSDIDKQLMEVTTEPGEFCFSASSTTTTITTTTTTATTTPSIGVSPDPMWKSRWVSLPYLLVIEGTGTQFKCFQTRLSFEPPGVVFPFFPIIWNELYIWDIVWVMPGWLAGFEDQTVTVTVTTGDEEVGDDYMIKLLPFILDQ